MQNKLWDYQGITETKKLLMHILNIGNCSCLHPNTDLWQVAHSYRLNGRFKSHVLQCRCLCSRLVCKCFGGEKVPIPGAPWSRISGCGHPSVSLWRVKYVCWAVDDDDIPHHNTCVWTKTLPFSLKNDFLPLSHVKLLDGFDSSEACMLFDRLHLTLS